MKFTTEQMEFLLHNKVFDRLHQQMKDYKDKYKTLFVTLYFPRYNFYLETSKVQLFTFFILIETFPKKILVEMKYELIRDKLYEYVVRELSSKEYEEIKKI